MSSVFRLAGSEWPSIEWHETDRYISRIPSNVVVPEDEIALHTSPEQLCFLQYTSGSTSFPKVNKDIGIRNHGSGVMITHRNLLENITTILHSLRATPPVVVVSWLPQVCFYSILFYFMLFYSTLFYRMDFSNTSHP